LAWIGTIAVADPAFRAQGTIQIFDYSSLRAKRLSWCWPGTSAIGPGLNVRCWRIADLRQLRIKQHHSEAAFAETAL